MHGEPLIVDLGAPHVDFPQAVHQFLCRVQGSGLRFVFNVLGFGFKVCLLVQKPAGADLRCDVHSLVGHIPNPWLQTTNLAR